MMKRVLLFAVSTAMLLCCAGCVGVNISAPDSNAIVGKGAMTTLEYTVDDYTAVELYGNVEFEIYYTADQSGKVMIEAQENLLEHLGVSVNGGVLEIKSDKRLRSENGMTAKLHIYAPTLEKLVMSGGLTVKQADTIKSDSFYLNVSGAIDGDLSFEVNMLEADISGACDLILSGSAEEAGIQMSGAGSIDASGLQTKRTGIEISGAGDVSIACSDTLDVDINGAGDVSYKGDPKVTKKISGAASVTRLD